MEYIFRREIGSNHFYCILFTVVASKPLPMPRSLMLVDGSLEIRSVACDPRPTVMVRLFLSENDEFRSETLYSFLSRSIKGSVLFLEDAVLLGGDFGSEIVIAIF